MGEFEGRLNANTLNRIDGFTDDVFHGAAPDQLRQLRQRGWQGLLQVGTLHAPVHIADKKRVERFGLGERHRRDFDRQGHTG